MDNKITNDKLKKLTEEVSNLNPTDFCNVMHKFALDIINRLQAELKVCNEALDNSMKLNSHLQAENERLKHQLETLCLTLKLAKTEAYKECIEKVEERLAVHSFTSNSTEYTDGIFDCMEWVDSKIEELKKELEGK